MGTDATFSGTDAAPLRSPVSADAAAVRRLAARLESSPVGVELHLPSGERYTFGAGAPEFSIHARTARALPALRTLDLGLIADAYLDGDFDIDGNLLAMFELRPYLSDIHPFQYLWRFVQPLVFGQVRTNARAIRAHYEIDPEFHLSFLGGVPCYTQGVFTRADESLEEAMRRKLDFCLEACDLGPGSEVLEIGPGWGGFAEHAARRGINVTGVTNSPTSARYMRSLGERLGLTWNIVESDFLAYRPDRRFDAVVIMGVIEHLPDYRAVLERFHRVLRPGGRVYVDASAARVKYTASSFIYRRIYPGNHSFFVLHDFLRAVARTPFRLVHLEDDRVSYFHTFVRWAKNLETARERAVRAGGEWNYRRFHLYLWGSAHCFLTDLLQCYRLVLERPDGRTPADMVRNAVSAPGS